MIRYFDTSALAKRYLAEAGSAHVRSAFRSDRVVVARVTYAELLAALAGARRRGVIDEAERAASFARVDDDFRVLTIVEIRAATLRRIPELVMRHALRGYDAVQLAAALTVRDEGAAVDFWSADVDLVEAARAEGLRGTVPGGATTKPRRPKR